MGRRLIIEVVENGAIEITADSDDGFYPGEVPAILEEAAKMVTRGELMQHWQAVEEREAAKREAETRPQLLVPKVAFN